MTKENRIRYSRLTAIEEIGEEEVERLKKSTVLVAGCGALGSMAAIQLAASSVGNLRIIDFDTIELALTPKPTCRLLTPFNSLK